MKKKKIVCDMCHKEIASNKMLYKIKKKFLITDYDGVWSGMGKTYLCEDCIGIIAKQLAAKLTF